MNAKIKSGLGNLTPLQLVGKAKIIIQNMTDNANFPAPDPTLAALTTARAELVDLIAEAAFRDQRAIDDRDAAAEVLNQLLRQMASYVDYTAKGNGEIIRSSGFQVRKRPEPAGPIGQPVNFSAVRSDVDGSIKLNWKAVENSRTYQVEMTTADPALPATVWQQVGLTGRSRYMVDNLERGTMYWFRVKAVGSTSSGAYSDVALVMAA